MTGERRSPRPRRASLQDIASRVGTTKMTVSRCLRRPDTVAEPLRSRIFEVAEELSYLPNHAPTLLAQARSRSIGMLVPSVTNQVFSEVFAGAIDTANAADYRLMISHYGYDPQEEARGIASLLSYNADAIIMSDREHTDATLRMLQSADVPTVEIMDTRTPPLQQAVGYDNHAAAHEMIDVMIAEGRREIVYMAVRLDARTQQRERGYLEAMEAHGLHGRSLQSAEKSSFSVGAKLMSEVLDERPKTEAIFCTNDDVAVGAYFECLRRDLSVPGDLAIVGFHGLDVIQALAPHLGSVLTPRYRIGAVAIEQLLARIAGPQSYESVIDLGYEIMWPQSLGT